MIKRIKLNLKGLNYYVKQDKEKGNGNRIYKKVCRSAIYSILQALCAMILAIIFIPFMNVAGLICMIIYTVGKFLYFDLHQVLLEIEINFKDLDLYQNF